MTKPDHTRRHARSHRMEEFSDAFASFRPMDPVRSIKMKLIVVIAASVFFYMIIIWIGIRFNYGVLRTFPFALMGALILTQILARGMTRPLREMTAAARKMAQGDYSVQVHTQSQDEVGELAAAFNSMAQDLSSIDTQRKEMVANVSHELRTPVAALRAQLENLADGVVEPDEETLTSALAQVERLTRLIDYLLDLSRLDAGASALNLAEISADPFLANVIAEAQDAAADSSLQWKLVCRPADLILWADAERLRQVLTNLLTNAARHSPHGGQITVEAVLRDDERSITIDVLDQGSGIPLAARERVFDRFQRGNNPAQTGQSTGGTGLGLAISRWAMELHGGTIEILDPPAKMGSLIRLSLPLADNSEAH